VIQTAFQPDNPAHPRRWYAAKNVSGFDAPPGAAMLLTGPGVDAQGNLVVTRPTDDDMDPRRIVFADPVGIPKGGFGRVTSELPWWVYCPGVAASGSGPAAGSGASGSGPAGAVQVGTEVGTVARQWYVAPGTGWMVWATDELLGMAYVSGGGGAGGGVKFAQVVGKAFCPSDDWRAPCPGGSGLTGSNVTGSGIGPGDSSHCNCVLPYVCAPVWNPRLCITEWACLPGCSFDGGDIGYIDPGSGECTHLPFGDAGVGGGGGEEAVFGDSLCPAGFVLVGGVCVPDGTGGAGGGGDAIPPATPPAQAVPLCPANWYPAILVVKDVRTGNFHAAGKCWLEDVNGRGLARGETYLCALEHPSVDVNGDERPLYGTDRGNGDACQGCGGASGSGEGAGLCGSGPPDHDCPCGYHWDDRCGGCVPNQLPSCPDPLHPGPCGSCIVCPDGTEYVAQLLACMPPCSSPPLPDPGPFCHWSRGPSGYCINNCSGCTDPPEGICCDSNGNQYPCPPSGSGGGSGGA
jgi:hypothetical protein